MVTRFVSFGFKYGTPVDADLVLDVRFLDNPYFVPELKPLTGLDEPVVRHVMNAPETKEFLKRTRALLEYVMPKYEREGKSYLTIAVGCTGGRHRSVVIADELARSLSHVAVGAAGAGAPIAVVHRDVDRGEVTARDVEAGERSSALELKGATTPPPAASSRGDR